LILIPLDSQNIVPENSCARFSFHNFSTPGKISAWASHCGNLSK